MTNEGLSLASEIAASAELLLCCLNQPLGLRDATTATGRVRV